MTLNWRPSEADTIPEEIDTTSSTTTVYLRRNVEEKTRPDEDSPLTSHTYYSYEEAKIPRAEYDAWLIDKNQADLEYLFMMTGVDYYE